MSTGYAAADDAPLAPTEEQIEAMETQRAALRDVYGTSDLKSFEQGEAMVLAARKQVDEALQMLRGGDGLGEAYNEAMEKSPHLVEMESNPVLYLRFCNYDPWAAANNIAMYWKIRKEFFGERAFLPMVASGTGAMSEEDVEALKCGGTCILPPESNNRYVYFTDRARYCSLCGSQEMRARTGLYLLQTLLDNDDVIRYGMVIACVIDTDDKKMGGGVNNTPAVRMLKLFKSGAIPIRFRAFHLFVLRKRSFMETSVPVWLHVLERWKFISMRTVVHYSDSREAAISDLKQYGFLEEHTPEKLGGKYDIQQEFNKWLKHRLEVEQKKYGAVSARTPSNKISHGPRGSLPTEASLNALEDLATAAEKARVEEAKARKRKLDAIYQRNKRENERNSVIRLKEQMNSLRKENAALKAEHDSLDLSMERAILALEDHKKEQGRLEAVIRAHHFEGAPQRAGPVVLRLGQQPRSGTSGTAAFQRVPQSSSNDGGFFSNILRSFPGFGTPAAAPVSAIINNLSSQPNVDVALLQTLQASQIRPTNSQLAQQLQQQQLLLQLQQQHLIQRQAELAGVLLGANHPEHLHDFGNHLPPLPDSSAVPGTLLQQQNRHVPEPEKDVFESILRGLRE